MYFLVSLKPIEKKSLICFTFVVVIVRVCAGVDGQGVGGPHVGFGYVWPMSITVRAMTSQSDAEVRCVVGKDWWDSQWSSSVMCYSAVNYTFLIIDLGQSNILISLLFSFVV